MISDLYNKYGGQDVLGKFENFQNKILNDENYINNFHSVINDPELGTLDEFKNNLKKKDVPSETGFAIFQNISNQSGSDSPSTQSQSQLQSTSTPDNISQGADGEVPQEQPVEQLQEQGQGDQQQQEQPMEQPQDEQLQVQPQPDQQQPQQVTTTEETVENKQGKPIDQEITTTTVSPTGEAQTMFEDLKPPKDGRGLLKNETPAQWLQRNGLKSDVSSRKQYAAQYGIADYEVNGKISAQKNQELIDAMSTDLGLKDNLTALKVPSTEEALKKFAEVNNIAYDGSLASKKQLLSITNDKIRIGANRDNILSYTLQANPIDPNLPEDQTIAKINEGMINTANKFGIKDFNPQNEQSVQQLSDKISEQKDKVNNIYSLAVYQNPINKNVGVVDMLSTMGLPTDMQNRAKLAVEKGIVKTPEEYTGTEDQNNKLAESLNNDYLKASLNNRLNEVAKKAGFKSFDPNDLSQIDKLNKIAITEKNKIIADQTLLKSEMDDYKKNGIQLGFDFNTYLNYKNNKGKWGKTLTSDDKGYYYSFDKGKINKIPFSKEMANKFSLLPHIAATPAEEIKRQQTNADELGIPLKQYQAIQQMLINGDYSIFKKDPLWQDLASKNPKEFEWKVRTLIYDPKRYKRIETVHQNFINTLQNTQVQREIEKQELEAKKAKDNKATFWDDFTGNPIETLNNLGGYLWNSAIGGLGTAIGGTYQAASDLTKKLPFVSQQEDPVVKWLKSTAPDALSVSIGNKDKVFEDNFITGTAGALMNMIPAAVMTVEGVPVGFFGQGYSNAMDQVNASPVGKNISEVDKMIYATGVGTVQALISKLSLDKIFGGASNNLAIKTTQNVINKLAADGAPITARAFENASLAELNSVKNKALDLLGHAGTGATFGVAMNTADLLGKDILNKATGANVFELPSFKLPDNFRSVIDPKSWSEGYKQYLKAIAEGGLMGAMGGFYPALSNKTESDFKLKVMNAKTPEEINALKTQISEGIGKEYTEQGAQMLDNILQKYTLLNTKIPQEISNPDVRLNLANKLDQRDQLVGEIEKLQQSKENLDPAFHKNIDQQIQGYNLLINGINEDISNISAGKPSEVPVVPEQTITKEAQDLLASGAQPEVLDETLIKIAKDNGIEVTETTIPNDIIEQLKQKSNDTQNIAGVSSTVGEGKTTVEEQPIESTGGTETTTGGVLQTQGAQGEGKTVEGGEVVPEQTTELKTTTEEVTPTPSVEPTANLGKFEAKAKTLSDKIRNAELPEWLVGMKGMEDVKTSGLGGKDLKEMLANAIDNIGKLMDKGAQFASAVKESVKDLVGIFGEKNAKAIEDKIAEEYKIEENAKLPEITEEEYADFIDKGQVSQERLNDIAEKVKNNEELSEKEKVISMNNSDAIDKIIAETPELKEEEVKVEQPGANIEITDVPVDETHPKDDPAMTKVANAVNDAFIEGKFGTEVLDNIINQLPDTDSKVTYNKAKDLLKASPSLAAETRERVILNKNGTDVDQAILMQDLAELKGRESSLMDQIIASDDPAEKSKLQSQLANVRVEMQDNAMANRLLGRTSSNIFRLRQLWVNRDMDLASMEKDYMASKGIKELSPEQKTEIANVYSDLKETKARLDKAQQELADSKLATEAVKLENEKLKQIAGKSKKIEKENRNKRADLKIEASNERIQASKETLRKLRGDMNVGFNPKVAAEIAKIAAEKFYQGAVKLDVLVKDILDEIKEVFPDWTEDDVRTHLFSGNENVNKYFQNKGVLSPEELKAKTYEFNKMQAEYAKKVYQWQKDRRIDLNENKPLGQKIGDQIYSWQRFAVLSYPTTFLKLTGAVLNNLLLKPVRFAIGKGIANVAKGVDALTGSDFSSKMGVYGDPSFRALGKYYSEFIRNFSLQNLKEQFQGIDTKEILYGDKFMTDEWAAGKGFLEIPGRSHAYVKSFIKNPEFKFAHEMISTQYIKRMADIEQKLQDPNLTEEQRADLKQQYDDYDVTNENTMMKINKLSLEHAKESILMGKNALVQSFRKITQGSGLGSTLAKTELPIVSVPINYVSRAFLTKYGLLQAITGKKWGAKETQHPGIAELIYKGTENLTDQQGQNLAKTLQYGTMGAALFALGYYNRDKIKENKDGSISFFGKTIPKEFAHVPEYESIFNGVRTANSFKETDENWITSFLMSDIETLKKNPFFQEMGYGLLGTLTAAMFDKNMKEEKKIDMLQDALTKKVLNLAIPGFVQQVAQFTDKLPNGELASRKPEGDWGTRFVQTLEAAIPGLRQNVPLQYKDIFTNEEVNKNPTLSKLKEMGVDMPNLSNQKFKVEKDAAHPDGVMNEKEKEEYFNKVKKVYEESIDQFLDKKFKINYQGKDIVVKGKDLNNYSESGKTLLEKEMNKIYNYANSQAYKSLGLSKPQSEYKVEKIGEELVTPEMKNDALIKDLKTLNISLEDVPSKEDLDTDIPLTNEQYKQFVEQYRSEVLDQVDKELNISWVQTEKDIDTDKSQRISGTENTIAKDLANQYSDAQLQNKQEGKPYKSVLQEKIEAVQSKAKNKILTNLGFKKPQKAWEKLY